MTCAAPHAEAPDLMCWDADPSGTNQLTHCFFGRQPTTPEEVERAINVMFFCASRTFVMGETTPQF